MKTRKTPSVFLIIIIVIVGGGIYKQFNLETLSFEKPALVVVYSVVFIACLVIMIKQLKSKG